MVAAVSAGRTANVISVHFALRAPPTVNQALPVDIAIVPHQEFSSLSAHFEGQDGLTTDLRRRISGPRPTSKAKRHCRISWCCCPTREGMFMMTASVETDSDRRQHHAHLLDSGHRVAARRAPAAPSRRRQPPSPAVHPPRTKPARQNREPLHACAPGPDISCNLVCNLHGYVKTGRGHPHQRGL